MADKIHLHGLSVFPHIGYTDEERSFPQRVLLNMELDLGLSHAGHSGELSHSVDYAAVKLHVKELAENNKWVLAEQLGERICTDVLEHFERIDAVRVHVKKFVVPDTEWVGVELTRRR